MQTSVLLSIKPHFAERIFCGIKRYEFRKALFKNRTVKRIIVYATAPVGKVIGEFEIESILELEPEALWEHTQEHSGIHKDYFDAYFDGRSTAYAIKVGRTTRYATPLELYSHFNVKQAPQSFVYITHEKELL